MSDDYLTGRLARMAEVAYAFDPHGSGRMTFRERVRLTLKIWGLR